jgi:hypothetical protein
MIAAVVLRTFDMTNFLFCCSMVIRCYVRGPLIAVRFFLDDSVLRFLSRPIVDVSLNWLTRSGIKRGPACALAQLPRLISRLHDSTIDISRAPGSVVGFVGRARRGVARAPIGIGAAVMTAEAVCEASMTSDVRPAHRADMTCAERVHMGCGDATEVRGAHA